MTDTQGHIAQINAEFDRETERQLKAVFPRVFGDDVPDLGDKGQLTSDGVVTEDAVLKDYFEEGFVYALPNGEEVWAEFNDMAVIFKPYAKDQA